MMYCNVKADTVVHFSKEKATDQAPLVEANEPLIFTAEPSIAYTHKQGSPSDLKMTRTLLHELSRFGPCAAKGDVNGDGLEDLFVGAEIGQNAQLFIQRESGDFIDSQFTSDTTREDGDALFFDADTDGDIDLYVAAACPSGMEDPKLHVIYMNDGSGHFTLSANALPKINSSAACVVATDYDLDGDLDLFVGSRVKPREYPTVPRSYVLKNTNGKFQDVTRQLNDQLEFPGMVSSAVWTDLNTDKKPDLVIAGEWMPIRIFLNEGGRFSEQTKGFGLTDSHGWWNCLKVADLNSDGHMDILAGNAGRNSFFKPTTENPVLMSSADFDNNGAIDPIVTYYNPVEKDRFIVHNRLVLIDQVPGFKRRFETFARYASTPFQKSFTEQELSGAMQNKVTVLSSMLLINEAGRKFKKVNLPDVAQLSTLNDALIEDLNGDGNLDLIIVGNSYAQETLFGRYDASIGTVLMGDGSLNWRELENRYSNFVAD